MALTQENYSRGFLVDDELMAGVAANGGPAGGFLAFVLRHETGEYLGYREYPTLDAALSDINAIPRSWAYEKTSGCGGAACKAGECSKAGSCSKREKILGKDCC